MSLKLSKINKLIKENGNCVNLGRHLEARHKDLHQLIIDHTTFLDHKKKLKFNERVYCIVNDIKESKIDAFGKEARFINLFRGYCTKESTKKKREVAKINEYKRSIRASEHIQKRKETINDYIKLSNLIGKNDYKIGKKIYQHMNLMMSRDEQLYKDDLIEGPDYVRCPILDLRKEMITELYINQILLMTKEEYIEKTGITKFVSDGRIENMSKALSVINQDTGLSVHAMANAKRHATMSMPDKNGITGYQKATNKTKQTHLSKIDENGLNGYQRLSKYRKETITEDGITIEKRAHQRRHDKLMSTEKSNRRASAASIRNLKVILDRLNQLNIKYYFDTNEFIVKDLLHQRYYFYDLVIPEYQIDIEYQSKAYHPDPAWDNEQFTNWKPARGYITPKEKLEYDYRKANVLFEGRGMHTFFVWEDSVKEDIEDILCYIRTINTNF